MQRFKSLFKLLKAQELSELILGKVLRNALKKQANILRLLSLQPACNPTQIAF